MGCYEEWNSVQGGREAVVGNPKVEYLSDRVVCSPILSSDAESTMTGKENICICKGQIRHFD